MSGPKGPIWFLDLNQVSTPFSPFTGPLQANAYFTQGNHLLWVLMPTLVNDYPYTFVIREKLYILGGTLP